MSRTPGVPERTVSGGVVVEAGPDAFGVAFYGDVDLTCREGLRQMLARFAVSTYPCVVLDLSMVTSVSSTGLSALSALEEEARRRGGHLRLRNAPAALMPVLSAAGLSVATVIDTARADTA